MLATSVSRRDGTGAKLGGDVVCVLDTVTGTATTLNMSVECDSGNEATYISSAALTQLRMMLLLGSYRSGS